MADTQIDELRLDITVEDKTSGESSDKKVKNLATAISRLNKNLQAFDNAKFTKVFDNMSKGLDPFVKKIEKVSNALVSLATIVSKGGLDKAVKEVTGKVPELKTETYSDGDRKSEPIQAQQGESETINIVNDEVKQQISEYVARLQEAQNATDKFFNKFLTKGEKSQIEISNLKEELAALKGEFASEKADYLSTLMAGGDIKASQKEISETASQIAKIQKQLDKLNNTTKKSKKPLGQLLKSFGRIAMYRAVRRTIQEITQAFMESIDGIARYNSEFRDTMGSLQSSMAKAKASIGVAFYQVLILLEPLITQIANGIANLANSLAKVTANMRGVATYTKINTEYMKEYQSATQGTLLAFDTFTTLSAGQGTDYSKMFETGEDALDESKFSDTEKTLSNIFNIIKEIIDLVGSLWKAIEPILDPIINDLLPAITGLLEPIVEIATTIIEMLSPAIESIIKVVSGVITQISGAFKIISGLIKILAGDFEGAWDSIGEGFTDMVNGIANMFIGLGKFIIDVLNLLFVKSNPLFWILKAFGIDVGEQISSWNADWSAKAWNPIKTYANGGIMDGAGTMYTLAGENGAEIVAQGSQGTGVANVEQIAEAEYRGTLRALYEYGAAQNGGMAINLDMNKLGTAVASNVGFRNEANRRNAGLNWK